jgi:hypothetical protein
MVSGCFKKACKSSSFMPWKMALAPPRASRSRMSLDLIVEAVGTASDLRGFRDVLPLSVGSLAAGDHSIAVVFASLTFTHLGHALGDDLGLLFGSAMRCDKVLARPFRAANPESSGAGRCWRRCRRIDRA